MDAALSCRQVCDAVPLSFGTTPDVKLSIPAWTSSGFLPPHDAHAPVAANPRSPYKVTVADLATQLVGTQARRQIVEGLLKYRAGLHAVGLQEGFQWIDGSFCSDVEMLEGRPPGDIDVVTFVRVPAHVDPGQVVAAHPELFEANLAKQTFMCDAYVVSLDTSPHLLVAQSAYWSGVWGHTRSGAWKGFLQVDLDPAYDGVASGLLAANGVAP